MIRRALIVGSASLVLALMGPFTATTPAFADCRPTVLCAADDIGGPGALPGTTDPDALIVDPVKMAGKYQEIQETQVYTDCQLALRVNDTATTDPLSSPGNTCGGPPYKESVGIVGQYQGTRPWCVPASTVVALSAFGVTVTQQDMATAEGTVDTGPRAQQGTPIGNAAPQLNRRETRNFYLYDKTTDAGHLMSGMVVDIHYYRAPAIIAVHTSGLDWWASQGSNQGGHALTVAGYDMSGAGRLSMWDTAFNNRYSYPLPNTYAANKTALSEIVW